MIGRTVGVAIDLECPIDFRGNGSFEFDDRVGKVIEGSKAVDVHVGGARGEEHFGLEDEPVAFDADVLAPLQEFAQPAKEVGAIALQFLDLARQARHSGGSQDP